MSNCVTLVILPNQLATECDLRFLELDCDPVLSDLNLTASKMACDGAPVLVCWVTFMEIILLIILSLLLKLKQIHYILKKNIEERCLVEFIGCFVLVG